MLNLSWILVLLSLWLPLQAASSVSVLDFDARPNDGRNDAEGLRRAMKFCRENPGTTLVLPDGIYDFRDDAAVKIMNLAMTGKYGNNPEAVMMSRDFPHVLALDLSGARNITIQARNASLIFDGWYQPITLDHSRKVSIIGLSIDYSRPPYSVGKIINIGKDHFDARFDSRYPLNPGMPGFCVDFYDVKAGRRHGVALYNLHLEQISEDILRIHGQCPEKFLDDDVIVRHSAHGTAAVMARYAQDLKLKDVTIHSHPGMGVVGHRCRNLTFEGLSIVPRAGEIQSTNTDATHFTSCTGTIRFDGCRFEGQGDDSTNIHNYYYSIKEKAANNSYLVFVNWKTALHALDHDYPEAGDTLELVDSSTLEPVRQYRVADRKHDFEKSETLITLHESLPGNFGDYYLLNASRFPAVRFTNSHISSHLARGILIKTRNVLIEGCTITGTTGTGIHVGAEGSWYEGGPTADLIIRNNRIINCGLGHGTQNGAAGIAVNVKSKNPRVAGLHKNILIEGNQITGLNAQRGIFISGADNVTIRHNQFAGCEVPIRIEYSTGVRIYGNGGILPSLGPGTVKAD